MTNLRIFWVIWCCMWALGWLLAGFASFGIAWLGVPVSLLCILIPIGNDSRSDKRWSPAPRRPQYPASAGSDYRQQPSQPSPPPGYYADPSHPGSMRWWDGHAWGPANLANPWSTSGGAAPGGAQPAMVTEHPPSDRTAGWKQDPWGIAATMRYWDGRSWTPHTSSRGEPNP